MSINNKTRESFLHKHGTAVKELIHYLKNHEKTSNVLSELGTELRATRQGQKQRLEYLRSLNPHALEYLCGEKIFAEPEKLDGNIENYIGMTMVPTGIIGPVSVNGTAARGEFYVPLATSEGALVASYHRGAKACRLSGGITSACLVEAVQRSPLFRFSRIDSLGEFLLWVLQQQEKMEEITRTVSRYAQLVQVKTNIEGNHLTLVFDFTTGDAAGQNMVTLCTDAICHYLVENAPVKPNHWYVEGNYSGDKKATALSFTNVRGKKVTAEVVVPKNIVEGVLKTTPRHMHHYWQSSTVSVIQSGAIGAQGHFANGLTALFMATGQDVACVSEASVGITRMEETNEGDLYCSITLPNLIVGTVGGGTGLPTQRECLELMDCYGEGKARKFAEICTATVLCGELSIAAALSAGHFSSAHKKLGRKKEAGEKILINKNR